METLHLELQAPSVGVDDAHENPLFRATRDLLETGQSMTALSSVVLLDGLGNQRWLGIFVLCAGGRILLFPGFPEPPDRLGYGFAKSGHGRLVSDRSFAVDHLSLEPDRASWHLTQKNPNGKRKQQGGGRTRPLEHGRVSWFGLIAAGLPHFRGIGARTIASAKCPPNSDEVRRRLTVFGEAVSGADLIVIPVEEPPSGNVLFVEVVVGSLAAPDFTGPLHLPGPIPGVSLKPPAGVHRAKLSRTRLSTDIGLQIVSAWIPGHAGDGLFFTWTEG